MSDPRLLGSARTVFGAIGGGLKDVGVAELGEIAAAGALEAAATPADRIDLVICAIGMPTAGGDLGLAAAIAERIGAPAGSATRTLIGVDAASAAVSLGHRSASAGKRVLVVGADSASQAAYWVGGVRLGSSEDGSLAIDPLGSALDPLEAGESPPHLLESEAAGRNLGRSELDSYAARSHAAAVAARALTIGDLDRDELVIADPQEAEERIAASPSLHTRGGDLTVANCAAPIDGAVASVLGADGAGPRLGAPAEAASEPGSGSATAAAAELARDSDSGYEAVLLGECSAAQALVAIADLGIERDAVNPTGGGIAIGRPSSGEALALLAAAGAHAVAGPVLVADEGPTGTGLAVLLSP